MNDFKELTVQGTSQVGHNNRHIAYDAVDRLGGLPEINYRHATEHFFTEDSPITQAVRAEVAKLQEQGVLPPDAEVQSGNSHVAVGLPIPGAPLDRDFIFAIYDKD